MRQILLQNATSLLSQNATEVYYKMRQGFCYKMRQFYYKIWQLLQNGAILLQNATVITKCDGYYKLRQCTYILEVEAKNNVVEDENVLKTVFPILNFPNANVFVSKSLIYSCRVLTVPYKNRFHFAFVVFTYLKFGFLHTNYYLKLLGGIILIHI